jgi:hypothetical protein
MCSLRHRQDADAEAGAGSSGDVAEWHHCELSPKTRNAMRILMILYKSALPIERVEELFRERSAKYTRVRGLLDKIYVHDRGTGEVGGIYVFDNQENLERFRSSDLERSIQDTYEFTEPPRVRTFEVPHVLCPARWDEKCT